MLRIDKCSRVIGVVIVSLVSAFAYGQEAYLNPANKQFGSEAWSLEYWDPFGESGFLNMRRVQDRIHLDYHITGRGGGEYRNASDGSGFGATYGVDIAVHAIGDWGLFGSANGTSITNGEQFLGTVGTLKLPDHSEEGFWARSTASVLFDQFTDSRYDNLYLSQFRFRLRYAFSENFEMGFLYSEPVKKEDSVFLFFDPSAGQQSFLSFRQSRAYAGYFATKVGEARLTSEFGFKEEPNSFILRSTGVVPLTELLNGYTAALYESDQAIWGVSTGVEVNY